MNIKKAYTFDDLQLIPRLSQVKSRSDVDLSVDLGKDIKLSVPLISANMKDITEIDMANALTNIGGLPILHRFCTIEEAVSMFLDCEQPSKVGCSIGVKKEDFERAGALVDNGCKIICIDVAHGHHGSCISMTDHIAEKYPHVLLIAGNVATAQGAKALAKAGANVIKAGVGPGSLCSTRIETGNGVPQMTVLYDVFEASILSQYHFKIIADGGIRSGGDCTKALCFSDAIMIGGMFAGTNEAPGKVEEINGIKYKSYEGSSTHKTSHVEGIKTKVPLKGPVQQIIDKLLDGIRSGCSYQGVNNLTDLKKDPRFVEISNAGLIESHPHSLTIK